MPEIEFVTETISNEPRAQSAVKLGTIFRLEIENTTANPAQIRIGNGSLIEIAGLQTRLLIDIGNPDYYLPPTTDIKMTANAAAPTSLKLFIHKVIL